MGAETPPAQPAQHTDEQLDAVTAAFNAMAEAVADAPVELVITGLLQGLGQLIANTSPTTDAMVANLGAVLEGVRAAAIGDWNIRLAEEGKAEVTLAQVRGIAGGRNLAELEADALAELVLATVSHRAPPAAVAAILTQLAPMRRRSPADMLAEFVVVVRNRMGGGAGVIVVPR